MRMMMRRRMQRRMRRSKGFKANTEGENLGRDASCSPSPVPPASREWMESAAAAAAETLCARTVLAMVFAPVESPDRCILHRARTDACSTLLLRPPVFTPVFARQMDRVVTSDFVPSLTHSSSRSSRKIGLMTATRSTGEPASFLGEFVRVRICAST